MSIDPLAEAMAGWSPYNYTFRNPISYGDPTGLAPEKNCPDCPVYEHPGVTITGSTPGRNYDQTVDRYGFNGTFAQWQSTYGYEGWSYENASAYYNSNIAPAFDQYVHHQDSLESDRIAIEKMGMFAQWYVMIGEVTIPAGGGGPTNGVIYKGPNSKNFNYNKLYNHLTARLEVRGITYVQYKDALDNPLLIKPVKYDQFGRPSQVYIGYDATAVINPSTGKYITAWKTGSKVRKKLMP